LSEHSKRYSKGGNGLPCGINGSPVGHFGTVLLHQVARMLRPCKRASQVY
jgi:hypothetical protein